MKKYFLIWAVFIGMVIPQLSVAQEEVNADVTNEIVEDEFQENFYEALKQRAIENYDKAVDFLMKCKQLDAKNIVVDFELGKNYADLKKYGQAASYLEKIVHKEPGNIWFMEALLNVYENQNNNERAIAIVKQLSEAEPKYKENLAFLYAKVAMYSEALILLDELDVLYGRNYMRDSLRQHLNTLLLADQVEEEEESASNGIDRLLEQMRALITSKEYDDLLSLSSETLEKYPAHPEVYYAMGTALNGLKKYKEAEEYLLMGLDYIIDDTGLQNNIYRQLVLAYKALGNTTKEKEYEKRIKG